MTTYVRVSGVWERLDGGLHARVSGVWQTIRRAYARVSGVWQLVHPRVQVPAVTVSAPAISPAEATAVIYFENDGDIAEQVNGGSITTVEDWLSPADAVTDFEIMFSLNSGAALDGGTLDTWLSLDTTRSLVQTRSTPGTDLSIVDVQIRDANTLTVVATGQITLDATVDV